MGEMGKAMMGTGESSGESRAIDAAEAAINNPLLDDTTMKGAHAVLINVTGGMDMTLFEVDEAANRIRKEVDPDAVIIFGSAFDEKLDGIMRVSVVATGIDTQTGVMARPVQALQESRSRYAASRTSTIITPRTIGAGSNEPVADAPGERENDDRQIDIGEAVAAASETTNVVSSGEAETDSQQDDKDSVFESESKILAPTAELTDADVDIAATSATATLQPEPATEAKADIMTKPLVADKADDLLLPEAPAKQHSFIPPAAAKCRKRNQFPTLVRQPLPDQAL